MRYIILNILAVCCGHISLAQNTFFPEITNKSSNRIGIQYIRVTDKHTEVMFTYEVEDEYGLFSISSRMKIEDYHNPHLYYPILKFDNNKLDYTYRWNKGVAKCKLYFAKIAPGIETINIYEDVPQEDEPFRFEKVKISNPDNSPKTTYTEGSLKQEWHELKIKPYEGIYEQVKSNQGVKQKLALKKTLTGYDLIYLSGAVGYTWKEGDVKATLTETATNNLFKAKWYALNKSVDEDTYIKLEGGFLKFIVPRINEEELFIKLYPIGNETSKVGNSTGTGFALSKDGYIVTNYHVVEGANEILVSGVNGVFNKKLVAQIIATDRNNDLAVIKITDTSYKAIKSVPYIINSKNSNVGEQIYVLGYPMIATMGDEIKLTDGIISSNSGFKGDITAYQISAPIQPGNSGGPLFDKDGNIIGIVNSKHKGAENASYAIKSSYLINLINTIEEPINMSTQNLLVQKKSLADKVSTIKKYVYIIEVN